MEDELVMKRLSIIIFLIMGLSIILCLQISSLQIYQIESNLAHLNSTRLVHLSEGISLECAQYEQIEYLAYNLTCGLLHKTASIEIAGLKISNNDTINKISTEKNCLIQVQIGAYIDADILNYTRIVATRDGECIEYKLVRK